MPVRGKVAVAVALAMTLGLSAACSGDRETNDKAEPRPIKVTYKTSFGANGRDAYAWLAKEKGWFAEAGIDINIAKGAGGTNLPDLVSGQAQFAAVDIVSVAIAPPDQVKGVYAVAAIHQKNMASLITLNPNIKSARDLNGKKVGLADGVSTKQLFPAYLKLSTRDPQDVPNPVIVPTDPDQLIASLVSGKVDAIGQFIVGKPTVEALAAKEGLPNRIATALPYSDVVNAYGTFLWTTDKVGRDLVGRFRDVLMRALKYSLEHPKEAAAALNRAEPLSVVASAEAELNIMKSYAQLPDGRVGVVDKESVVKTLSVLDSIKLYTLPPGSNYDSEASRLVRFEMVAK